MGAAQRKLMNEAVFEKIYVVDDRGLRVRCLTHPSMKIVSAQRLYAVEQAAEGPHRRSTQNRGQRRPPLQLLYLVMFLVRLFWLVGGSATELTDQRLPSHRDGHFPALARLFPTCLVGTWVSRFLRRSGSGASGSGQAAS